MRRGAFSSSSRTPARVCPRPSERASSSPTSKESIASSTFLVLGSDCLWCPDSPNCTMAGPGSKSGPVAAPPSEYFSPRRANQWPDRRGLVVNDQDSGPGPARWIALKVPQHLLAGHVGQVQVQQDEVGLVLASEVQPQAPLHRTEQDEAGPVVEGSLDEPEVGQVVLDVQERVGTIWGRSA